MIGLCTRGSAQSLNFFRLPNDHQEQKMIIQTPSPDAADAKRREVEAAAREVVEVHTPTDDPPPTYTQSPDSPPPPPVAGTSQRASNYVSMVRDNGSIKGSWLIDPLLSIPRSLLPPLLKDETEETRKNLNIQSTNGSIDVDLTLAPLLVAKETLDRKRVTVQVKASNGSVRVATHAPHAPRLPFYVHVRAFNGSVTIAIPRSFHGLLTFINHNGHAKFVGSTGDQIHTFSDVSKTRRCFMGDYTVLSDEAWDGDEIFIDARNGHIKILYDDEEAEKQKQKGFFSRFLGL